MRLPLLLVLINLWIGSNIMNKYTALYISIIFLSGCAETYITPESGAPELWHFSKADPLIRLGENVSEKINSFWWQQFQDPLLNSLMEDTLKNNYDIKVSLARINEAQASASYPSRLPTISVSAGRTRQGNQSGTGGIDKPGTLYNAGFLAAWDLDLNGHLKHGDAAREAILEQVLAEHVEVKQTLLLQVGQTYLNIRYFQNLLKILNKNISLQKETVRITKIQQKAGALGKLDTTRAAAQLSHTKANLPKIQTSLAKATYRLSTLLGKAPGTFYNLLKIKKPLPVLSDPLILQSPAKIIAQRPDIKIAEMLFKQAVENKNVATAELLPNISLSAFFGMADSSIYGAALPWSFALNALGTLFDFGKLQSQVDMSNARKEQSFWAYKQTVLLALEEVEGALASYVNEKRSLKNYKEEFSLRTKSIEYARLKFNAGEVDFLNVLNEEERLLEAETSKLEAEYRATYTMMLLHKATGTMD